MPLTTVDAQVDTAAIDRIAAISDPALRNLWITQTYAALGARLGELLRDPASRDRNHPWCTFAVWASMTAGRTIRCEDLPAGVDRALQWVFDRLISRVRHHAGKATDADLRDPIAIASSNVAAGNTAVFTELAPCFVAACELLERDPAASDEELADALRAASAGTAPDELIATFAWYARAVRTDLPHERARAVLAGNIVAVAHEQRRLQPFIAAAMDGGLDELERRLTERWALDGSRRAKLLRTFLRGPARWIWERLATTYLMTLRVPGAELHLGETLPPLDHDRMFPAALADLASPPDAASPVGTGSTSAAVYGQWDRTGGTGRHDAAGDWAIVAERMNYIVNLFRSRQQDPSLAAAPFSAAQLDDLRAGVMPPPPLLPPTTRR